MIDANGERKRATEEDRIGNVVMTCVLHWRLRDVPDDRIGEMEEELEGHLHEAAGSGRPIESVVGGDPVAFAEEWAKEARTERSSLGRAFGIGADLAFGLAFVAAACHLLLWSLTFEVEVSTIVPVMLMVWFGVGTRISVTAGKYPKDPGWTAWVRGLAVVPLFFVPYAVAWAVTGEPNAELFGWGWKYTLAALVAAVVLGRFSKRSVGQE